MDSVELLIEELAKGELLPPAIYIVGGGAALPDLVQKLEIVSLERSAAVRPSTDYPDGATGDGRKHLRSRWLAEKRAGYHANGTGLPGNRTTKR